MGNGLSFYSRSRYSTKWVLAMVLAEDGGFSRQEVQTAGCSLPCEVEMTEHLENNWVIDITHGVGRSVRVRVCVSKD